MTEHGGSFMGDTFLVTHLDKLYQFMYVYTNMGLRWCGYCLSDGGNNIKMFDDMFILNMLNASPHGFAGMAPKEYVEYLINTFGPHHTLA